MTTKTQHPAYQLPTDHPQYPHTARTYALQQLINLPEDQRPPMKEVQSYHIVMDKQQLIMIEYALQLAQQLNPAINNVTDQFDDPVVETLRSMLTDTIDAPHIPGMIHGFVI